MNKIKNYFLALLLPLFFCFTFLPSGTGGDDPEITAREISETIKYLASDELGGRFPGTKGDSLTEQYIIKKLKSYGIKPAGEIGFRQPFSFTSEIKLGEKNNLMLMDGKNISSGDFTPVYLSSNGSANGNAVFVGYGINAPDLNYNDYAGIDIKGKIAIMMDFSPGYNNPHDNPFGKYERLRVKCKAAAEQGAAGIIVIKGPETGDDELYRLRMYGHGDNVGIPVINVRRSIIEPYFTTAGRNLQETQKNIDSTKI